MKLYLNDRCMKIKLSFTIVFRYINYLVQKESKAIIIIISYHYGKFLFTQYTSSLKNIKIQ